MRKNILILLAFLVTYLAAEPVDKQLAAQVASNWFSHVNGEKGESTIKSSFSLDDNGDGSIYVFNFEEGGFVLVAADDVSIPVLGYSTESDFVKNTGSVAMSNWFGAYEKEIKRLQSVKSDNRETKVVWQQILDKEFSDKKGTKAVEPLVQSKWNQNPLYNNYCPTIDGELAVVGCVATAMAQIVNYHQYPPVGKGSKTYTDYYGCGQTLSADFENSIYNWDLMPNRLTNSSTEEEIHEVAQISYHLGVSVKMMYGTSSSGGSGAFSQSVPGALEDYFNYNSDIEFVEKEDYSDSAWKQLLKSEFNNDRPVYYSGRGDGGGHAFVCDGYQNDDYFHFNWGWNGQNDGYFYLTSLNPGSGGAGGGGYDFTNDQGAVIKIYPNPIDLVQLEQLVDLNTKEDVIVVDLADYFESNNGNSISYTVEKNTNPGAVETSISGTNLIITRKNEGIADLKVYARTSSEHLIDEFRVKFSAKGPKAGFGSLYNFSEAEYVDAGNNQILNEMEKISISTWFKLNEVDKLQGIISKSASTSKGWNVFLNAYGKMKFLVNTDKGKRYVYAADPLQKERWYHLGATYDGNNIRIYLDGKLEGEETYDEFAVIKNSETSPMFLGRVAANKLDGNIDNTSLWNRVLSLNEIKASSSKVLFGDEDGLIGYWDFDENFGREINDATGLNNGELVSSDDDKWENSSTPLLFHGTVTEELNGELLGDKGDGITYAIVDSPAKGELTLIDSEIGTFKYIPEGESTDVIDFSYKITKNGYESEVISVIIKLSDTSGLTNSVVPEKVELYQNYPNPFNPSTVIRFYNAAGGEVRLSVYNVKGELVETLVNGSRRKGFESVNFDAKGLNSGLYYYKLETPSKSLIKKMMLIK